MSIEQLEDVTESSADDSPEAENRKKILLQVSHMLSDDQAQVWASLFDLTIDDEEFEKRKVAFNATGADMHNADLPVAERVQGVATINAGKPNRKMDVRISPEGKITVA